MLALTTVQTARAETATDFLSSLEGSYSGRGEATVIGDKKSKVSCKISNVFEESQSSLVVSGECASTRGKGKISGSIVASGGNLRGNFLSPRKGMEVTQSSGSYSDGTMQLSSSMVDQEVGRLTKVRQIITRTETGIAAAFFVFDNATQTYEPSGNITLRKRAQ